MKTIRTGGITYIEPVPGGTAEWYYGIAYEHGDLYEAEEIFNRGEAVEGRDLILVHFPDGEVYRPVLKTPGEYSEAPIFFDGSIYILNVRFQEAAIQMIRFGCFTHKSEIVAELPLNAVTDCYNLRLHTAPLTLTRQGGQDHRFEIIWPENKSFEMGEHESFFLRDGEKLLFNKWHEKGEGKDYQYWEETVIRDLDGNILEELPGDIQVMPNGELWHLQ